MSTRSITFWHALRQPRLLLSALLAASLLAASPLGANIRLAQAASYSRLLLLRATPSQHGVTASLAWVSSSGGTLHALGSLHGAYQGVAVRQSDGLLALGSTSGLVLVSSDGQREATVRPSGAPAATAMPAWSPDGGRLAFLAAPPAGHKAAVEHALWVAGRDGRGARQVLNAQRTADLLTLAWSPEGHSLLLSRFARGQGAISMLDLRTGHETFLAHGFDAVWSPNGKIVAYDVRGRPGSARLWLLDAHTHHARQLVTRGLTQAAVPVWSADGHALAFFGTTSTAPTFVQPYGLYTVAAAGGQPRLVVAKAASLLPVGQGALVWSGH